MNDPDHWDGIGGPPRENRKPRQTEANQNSRDSLANSGAQRAPRPTQFVSEP